MVFSSDPYVAGIAERFGAEPVVVDAERATVPISATDVRDDPAAHLEFLAPNVREWVEANLVRPERRGGSLRRAAGGGPGRASRGPKRWPVLKRVGDEPIGLPDPHRCWANQPAAAFAEVSKSVV